MQDTDVNFAKIVSSPTFNSWSQVYNAGKLFAVLSLGKTAEAEENDEQPLNLLGKDILNSLEEEYFTLEEKSLKSIKQALLITSKKIPENISASFLVTCAIGNILYLFILGKGKILLKRKGKVGTILAKETEEKDIVSASGFLENNDLLIVETEQFENAIEKDELIKSLDQPPSEIAELLSPKIHKEEQGGASALILSFVTVEKEEESFEKEEETEVDQKEPEHKQAQDNNFYEPRSIEKISRFKKPNLNLLAKLSIIKKFGGLNHSRKIIINIIVIILIVFVVSIFFAQKRKEEAKTKALFADIYAEAQKKYDEGQALVALNKNLAKDDFSSSQKILTDSLPKFNKNSDEAKKINELLQKIDESLKAVSDEKLVEAKEVNFGQSTILSLENKSGENYYTSDDSNIYSASKDGIFSYDKKGENKKTIIKNNSFWKEEGGLGIYNGNAYLLDKKGGILKFVGKSESSKNDYLTSSVDLTKAVSVSIDSSIYVLFSDGNIIKFTRGKPDTFKATGLDAPLSSPTRIATAADFDNIYVLDNGNQRIVVLGKEGAYKSQYKTGVLKDAKDFEVLEKDKKILILSSSKLYQIDLK